MIGTTAGTTPRDALDGFKARARDQSLTTALDWLSSTIEERRISLSPQEWRQWTGELRADPCAMELLTRSPLVARALRKPRGYAGDAVMLDMIYGAPSVEPVRTDTEALRLLASDRRRPVSVAIRERRRRAAATIDRVAARKTGATIVSVAAGHAREVELSEAVLAGRVGRLIAVDHDAENTAYVRQAYGHVGVGTLTAGTDDIIRRRLQLPVADLICATGVYDSLDDRSASLLTARLFERLAPGGMLLMANLVEGIPDRGFIEAVADWHMVYRDEAGLRALLPPTHTADIRGSREGWIAFLEAEVP